MTEQIGKKKSPCNRKLAMRCKIVTLQEPKLGHKIQKSLLILIKNTKSKLGFHPTILPKLPIKIIGPSLHVPTRKHIIVMSLEKVQA